MESALRLCKIFYAAKIKPIVFASDNCTIACLFSVANFLKVCSTIRIVCLFVCLFCLFIYKGLADESEYVRDTSLKAGQRIVNLYADTAIELFLPELEKGLFDDNWRIRHSSVQLLGDLLYRISGVTGKMSTEGQEDDNFGTSQSNQVT